jgi:hypothetical protein
MSSAFLTILAICLFCAINATQQGTFLTDADFARARLLIQNKAMKTGSTVTQNIPDKFGGFSKTLRKIRLQILDDIVREPGSNNRNAVRSPSRRWPNARVPYMISQSFNENQ